MAALPPPPPVPPEPVDTFAELNDGDTDSIRTRVTTLPRFRTPSSPGWALAAWALYDASMAALRSSFDPNTANADGRRIGAAGLP